MKERLKRVFGVFGGFFGRVVTPLAVAMVVVFVLGWFVGWPGATVYFAADDYYHRGRIGELATDNLELEKALDAAAVESGQLQYERDSYKEAATQLEAHVQQLQAQMANMLRFEQVQWCDMRQDGKLVMPIELLPEEMRDIVLKTASFARGVDPDTEFAAVCVSVDEILISPLRGEMDFRVIRYYPNGDRDWLIVYWRQLPGSTEGELRTAEFYNVLTREQCWLDEVTQSWLCKNLSP